MNTTLSEFYDEREVKNIINIYFQDKFQMTPSKIQNISNQTINIIENDIKRFRQNEPVQYITGKSWFYKSMFSVDRSVLIPRSETEELVDLILQSENKNNELRILDIGTGSGCIALSIGKEWQNAIIEAIDISEDALLIAEKNKIDLNITNVIFNRTDFLDEGTWKSTGKFDILVSNPPYISKDEKNLMSKSTLLFEPHLALFPENPDHLIFYRKIFEFAKDHLNPEGKIYCEINEFHTQEILNIIPSHINSCQIYRDIQNKERILIAGI